MAKGRSLSNSCWLGYNLYLIKGYDEEKQVKYWLLQNSWGENWGENGYFKMLRGTDHLGIESICEAGSAIPINH